MGRNNNHMKQMSEIPKNNRHSDKIISEIELNDAEDYVMSGESAMDNPAAKGLDLISVNTPRDYTGSGQQNKTRIEEGKRSTMIGINLFNARKPDVGKEKKVNFDNSDSSDGKIGKHKRHYTGNFQSQYRKKQFIENPGSDDEFSRQAEDDEFFDYKAQTEKSDAMSE
jgi:hypothetical protein